MTTDPDRDPAVARAWSAHSRELPPPALDQAILAAAHRAVNAGPRDAAAAVPLARRPQKWWMPLAAAAVIGVVAIGVVQMAPESELLTPHEKLVATPNARTATTSAAETDARKQDASRAPVVADAAPAEGGQRPAASAAPMQAPAAPAAKAQDDQRTRADASAARNTEAAPAADRTGKPTSAPAAPAPDRTGKRAAAPEPFPGAMPAPAAPERKAEAMRSPPIQSVPATAGDIPAPATAPKRRAQVEVAEPVGASDNVPSRAARNESRDERQVAGSAAGSAPPPPPLAASAPRVASAPPTPLAAPAARDAAAPPAPPAAPAAPAMGRFAAAPPSAPRNDAVASESAGRASMSALQSASTPLAKNAGSDARTRARDPDAWLMRIRKLREDGDVATAERELREFRQLVPDADARIPPDMRAWAATVR